MMAAAALLSATLKFDGSLIMQMQGSGPVQLLVVEATSEHTLRATAKWEGELPEGNVKALLGSGRFVISIVPEDGKQTYQGIVDMQGESIAEVLEHYMANPNSSRHGCGSPRTRSRPAGMLLQKLPAAPTMDADAWNRATRSAAPSATRSCCRCPRPKSSAGFITRKTCAYSNLAPSPSAAPVRASA